MGELVAAAFFSNCADWCRYSPSSTWNSIPACSGCDGVGPVEVFSRGRNCARWCHYSPSSVWSDIPSCSACYGYGNRSFIDEWLWPIVIVCILLIVLGGVCCCAMCLLK